MVFEEAPLGQEAEFKWDAEKKIKNKHLKYAMKRLCKVKGISRIEQWGRLTSKPAGMQSGKLRFQGYIPGDDAQAPKFHLRAIDDDGAKSYTVYTTLAEDRFRTLLDQINESL